MTRITEYLRPTSVEEALSQKKEAGDRAFYLAGGTDALVFPPANATTAIDIMRLGLSQIREVNGRIEIGATALLRDIERHPSIQTIAGGALTEAIRETGPWLIRNAGTLAGNLCNASPSADSAPMLLALDAEIVLSDDSSIYLDEFFTGPHRTVLGDRLVTAIRIDPRGRHGRFHKLSRSKSDIAQVNLAITANVENNVMSDVRVALGAVGPTPLRCRKAEHLLEGAACTPDIARQAADIVRTEIAPIDDWRATAEYRLHAAGILVSRALQEGMMRDGKGKIL